MEYSTSQHSCVNCAVKFQRNVPKQLLHGTAADVRNLISESIPRELCIPCGTSLLRALQTHAVSIDLAKRNIILQWIPTHQVDRLDQVCMPCWLKAHRAVQRYWKQDCKQDVVSQLTTMDVADSSSIPKPPPMPSPPPIVYPSVREVPTITMSNYKRAVSTS